MSLTFTMACQAYDRMDLLRRGAVRLGDAEVNFLDLPVEETFFSMARFREFDIAEMSLSSYTLSLSRGAPFVAIPVFPSRAFRHSAIYVREDSEITDAAQLAGRAVGVPEYQITAAVWIRGILAEHHGLPVSSVSYRTGGLDEPGRYEKIALDLPDDVSVTPISEGRTLSQMLLDGEIDAIHSARNPGPYNAPGHGGIRRLFPDTEAVERDYFARTGIFPIMHVLVVRRDVYEQHRWLPRELMKAAELSKRVGLAGIDETAALRFALPWLWAEVERTREALGDDWWPYGLEANRHVLDTFLRYSHEQGLAPERYRAEDLFAPETLERVIV
ncbi:ABC transporter substrate-binding protein [Microbacterium sp. MEC084]|uniref:ABC transporter substrate-binding protein n=1 Tax=Microbacterium sp. MEC084 TaxID=1963027 RepID=UPI00106F840F|nr:ABC transporter substrate-binding protein [Microbacterium sp. MEC084]MCD1268476.1 ABC transporter substrate-binding protein [Microbacterium sp. MEC084]